MREVHSVCLGGLRGAIAVARCLTTGDRTTCITGNRLVLYQRGRWVGDRGNSFLGSFRRM